MKNALNILMLFSLFQSFAQNLVPNPSFEDYITIPAGVGAWDRCIGWTNIQGGSNPSPDYFHVNSSYPIGIPYSNGFGSIIFPHTGDAVMGFVAYSGTTEYREYLAAELVTPMIIGETYTVSFWITNGEKTPDENNHVLGATACNRVGIHLSANPLYQSTTEPIGVIPQFEIFYEFFSEDWELFSYDFIADSAYNNISIGNFYPDSLTSATLQPQFNSGNMAYYFLDDISVKLKVENEYSDEDEIVISNVFTPNNDGINDILTINLKEGQTLKEFVILNRWGNVVYTTGDEPIVWDGQFSNLNCSEGTYFWSLIYRTETGNLKKESGFLNLLH